jgi:flagellin
MLSLQTNIASLIGQNNLANNQTFQQNTIQQLTSGYRINSAGDDAAGLAVANQYRASIAELTQGVQNANNGLSSLQIADGGLSNISTMLDRLKTLATESASSTFTGNRSNINVEYQQLTQEITQQATNIGLNAGGSLNTVNRVFVGGGTGTNAQATVDLSGAQNAVDALSLGLANTTVIGGGTELTGNSVRLDAPGATFLSGATQTFAFNITQNGAATSFTATVDGTAAALTQQQVISSLNSQLSPYGITAQVDANGQLNFGGGSPFTVKTTTADAADPIATTLSTATNGGTYSVAGAAAYTGKVETLSFMSSQGSVNVSMTAADTLTSALAKINAATQAIGISAVDNAAGTGISLQSNSKFTVSTTAAAGTFTAIGAQATTAPTATSTSTGNAIAALASIDSAISQLGNVQSAVGAGENTLMYATDLANSQITNFSAAQSRIRDANVASEAANLSQAQVLVQSSVAAMAQANSAPQSLLKLLG